MSEETKAKNTDNSAFEKAVISWTTPEFITYEKGTKWKITMSIFVLALAAFGFFYGAWTFSLAVIAFALVYALMHNTKPRDITVKVSDIGIKVGERQYAYSQLKGFYMLYNPPVLKNLILQQTGAGLNVTIPLNDQDPAALRDFLRTKITEIEGQKEAFTESITRLLKL